MFDVSKPLALSDGTPVEFVKTTSKGNTQVRLPDDHDLGSADPLRIFRPDGSHYKDLTPLTLVNADGAVGGASGGEEQAEPELVRGDAPVTTEDRPTPPPSSDGPAIPVAPAKLPTAADVVHAVAAMPQTGVITYIDLGADGKFGLFRLPS